MELRDASGQVTLELVADLVIPPVVRAVVFDVGETLVDETRAWSALADRVGVTRLTLFAALGALIERDEDHRLVWDLLGVDRPAHDGKIEAVDFYPDALPCLRAVREAGYTVGLAGNQPVGAEAALGRLGLPVDLIASSARWGVEKPSPAFFDRINAEVGLRPEQVAYVGDRLDNDVLPAKAAGMFAVFIRRGPWGHLHAHRSEAACADVRIDSLAELTTALRSEDRQP
ncbi:MAG: HAD family hydrolase [Actinomycetota bacterium]|jgi:HAD superfamily hydrolase (TIGR01509 family)|nr:HAD family hydrolase [Actinomycetota bacterium]